MLDEDEVEDDMVEEERDEMDELRLDAPDAEGKEEGRAGFGWLVVSL